MRSKYLTFLLLLILGSCGVVKKKTTYGSDRTVSVPATSLDSLPEKYEAPKPIPKIEENDPAEDIIETAMGYSGVRYKFGGTTKKGMDCSGLLYVSFGKHDIDLPRVSIEMAEEAKKINLKNVDKGDLLFFKTSKKGKRINHVGMVVDVNGPDIRFIHATTSRGVIVSSLNEGFWNYSFVKAARVL